MTFLNGNKDRRSDERKADLAIAVSCVNTQAYRAGATVYEFRDDGFYRSLGIPLRKGFKESDIFDRMPKPEYQNGWHRDIAVDSNKGALCVLSDFEYNISDQVRRAADSMIQNDTVSVLGRVIGWIDVEEMQFREKAILRRMSEAASHPSRISDAELDMLPRLIVKTPLLKDIHTIRPPYQVYVNSYEFVFSINLSLNFFDAESHIGRIQKFVSDVNDELKRQEDDQRFEVGVTLRPIRDRMINASLYAIGLKSRYITYKENYDAVSVQEQLLAVEEMSKPVLGGGSALNWFVRLFSGEIKAEELNRFLVNGRR
ncbi:MAG: hypothetical protein KGH98_03900 [Candidatus Micrarchaeota archaeon]|nr:hypothetical protein [Candidatus Micrarchaeota archaeon]